MNIEYHPGDFDYLARFPDAHCVVAGEGETCYAAIDDFGAMLITDSGSLAYLLPEDDLFSNAVSIRRFSSVAERDQYVADLTARCRREKDVY